MRKSSKFSRILLFPKETCDFQALFFVSKNNQMTDSRWKKIFEHEYGGIFGNFVIFLHVPWDQNENEPSELSGHMSNKCVLCLGLAHNNYVTKFRDDGPF